MIRVAVLLATPASMSAVFLSPLIVYYLWKGRWTRRFLSSRSSLPRSASGSFTTSRPATIDSKGFWKTTAFIVLIDGFLTLIASIIGCWYGSITSLAIAIAIEPRRDVDPANALHTPHHRMARADHAYSTAAAAS